MNIDLIIPVYNEQDSLPEVIRQLDELLLTASSRFSVILVDDGSTDNSREILSRLDPDHPQYTVVTHQENRGYGAALKTGLRLARADYVGIIDADGTYPVEAIPRLAACLEEGWDMVVGDRSASKIARSGWRGFLRKGLTVLAAYLAGRLIPDLNSGLRLMRKSQVERFLNLLPDGFSFTTTITLAMLTSGLPVCYLPIEYYARQGQSKIRPVYDTINFLQLIIRTVMYFRPLKVFAPLSLLLFLAAFVVLYVSWWLTGQPMDVTFGVLLMTSALVLVLGLLADLIVKRVA